MAKSVTLRSVQRLGGRVYVRFSNKVEMEFSSPQQMRDWARSLDAEEELLLMKLLVRWWLYRNVNGDDATAVQGKRMTINLESPTLLEIV